MYGLKRKISIWLLNFSTKDDVSDRYRWLFFDGNKRLRRWASEILNFKLFLTERIIGYWGDKEFAKDNFERANYFYAKCPSISQNPHYYYAQMLKCGARIDQGRMFTSLIYMYYLRKNKRCLRMNKNNK